MDNKGLLFFLLKSRKEEIVNIWLQRIEELYPSLYNTNALKESGAIYFELLTDYHIPLEEHHSFEIITKLCSYHIKMKTPIEHIFHSSHIWRKSIYTITKDFLKGKEHSFSEIIEEACMIQERIDQLQQVISAAYIEHSNELIHLREKKINELHDEQLNLLGKMAANMAHEIRNPLTAIEGFVKLIRLELENCSSHKVKDYLDIMDNELEGLDRQVTGLLSFARNNGIEEEFVSYDSNELIHFAVNLVKPRLIDEKIVLQLLLDTKHPLMIQKIAIQQVLTNLINNAIDALQDVQQAKIIIISTFEDDNNFYIQVADNGVGIPEELKEKIFDPFVTGKQYGTGLGLSICKQILEKNNGDILFFTIAGMTSFALSLKKKSSYKPMVG